MTRGGSGGGGLGCLTLSDRWRVTDNSAPTFHQLNESVATTSVNPKFLEQCLRFCTFNLHPERVRRVRAFWHAQLDLHDGRPICVPLMALAAMDGSGLWRDPEQTCALVAPLLDCFDHPYTQVCDLRGGAGLSDKYFFPSFCAKKSVPKTASKASVSNA